MSRRFTMSTTCMRLFVAGIILLVSVHYLTQQARAQSSVMRANELTKQKKRAIVKIVVDGAGPDGTRRQIQGSGFFAYSAPGVSLIITARHVIGSSEIDQTKNNTWQVQNGAVNRQISVYIFDEQGTFQRHFIDVNPLTAEMPDGDIALLSIKEGTFLGRAKCCCLVSKQTNTN